jgi:hypothetical protein
VKQREFGCLAVWAQEHYKKILERVHERVSPERAASGVSMCASDKSAALRRFVFLLNRELNREGPMPQGDKGSYTSKQKRKAEHIEESYEERGVSKKEAEKRAWATVNKSDKGGKKSGSGRGKKSSKAPSRKGGKKSAAKKKR